eukprot:UN15456
MADADVDKLNADLASMMSAPTPKVKMSDMPKFEEPITDHDDWMLISFTSDVDDESAPDDRPTYKLYVPQTALTNELHAACLMKCGQQLSCGYT